MRRSAAVAVALFVAGSVLAPAALTSEAAAAQGTDATPVDSCTVISEPGEYELTGDLERDANETCLEIRADDVVFDGNGHSVQGPGPDAGGEYDAYRGIYVNFSDGVEIRNVEVSGWNPGIRTEGSDVSMTNVVVRNSGVGVFLEETGPTNLTDVTVENNDDVGIDTHRTGDLRAVDVTLDGNGVGLQTWDAHDLRFESSDIVDNDDSGVNLHHHSSLTLVDVAVSGNGGDGVEAIAHGGFEVALAMVGGTVSDNGGHGVAAIASAHADLDGVTVENNDGLELHGSQIADVPGRNVTASDLAVGPSATTGFEGESLDLEPVDRDSLPGLPDGDSAAGDGLNVSGPIEGPVDLELDVATDDDAVDLRRHDGDGWEIVEEDLVATGGTVEASVDRNGTYAPVASDDGDDSGDGTATPTQTPTETATPDPSPTETQTPSDQEHSEATPGQAPSGDDSNGPSQSTSSGSTGSSGTSGSSATPSPTSGTEANSTAETGSDQRDDTETDGTAAGSNSTTGADDAGTEGTDETDGGSTAGAGPGFGPAAALLALLACALLISRRRQGRFGSR